MPTDTTGIVTISQLQPISVVFTAPEESCRINKALEAGRVPVEALSTDGQRTPGEGTLALVNNQVDQASGTITHEGDLRQTMTTRCGPACRCRPACWSTRSKHVVVVPDDAVQRGPNGLYVFVVGDDDKVELRRTQGRPERRPAVGRRGASRPASRSSWRASTGCSRLLVQPTEAPPSTGREAADDPAEGARN